MEVDGSDDFPFKMVPFQGTCLFSGVAAKSPNSFQGVVVVVFVLLRVTCRVGFHMCDRVDQLP